MAGVDPRSFLNAETDEELGLLTLVANKAIEYQEVQMKNQAALIINYLGKALGTEKK